MKRLIYLFVLLFAITATAQTTFKINGTGYMRSTVTHAATDTITNAVTKNQFVQIDGYQDIIAVQPTFVKISGTAAATVKLQGSVDGVAYTDIGSSYTVTDVATQTTAWIITPSNYVHYRLNIVPTGTQSVKVTTPVLARKRT